MTAREEQARDLREASSMKRREKAERDARIRYHAAQGLTLAEIGRLLGISTSAVGRVLGPGGTLQADRSLPRGLPY